MVHFEVIGDSKLLVQVWHLLQGNPIELLDSDKSLRSKLGKLATMIGKERRLQMALPVHLVDCVDHLIALIPQIPQLPAAGTNTSS